MPADPLDGGTQALCRIDGDASAGQREGIHLDRDRQPERLEAERLAFLRHQALDVPAVFASAHVEAK